MIKIVVDSGCEMSEELRQKEDLPLASVPLNLTVGAKEFVDDDSLNMKEYLKTMSECSEMPKTAAPSPELYLKNYQGDESIFVVTLSSHLSSSFSSALLAKQMYLDEVGEKFIHVFDSLSASVGETLIALKINEFSKNNLSNLEIVDNINRFIGSLNTYFVLERYDNLIKSGRINPYIAKLASIFSIRPICKGVNGIIELVDKPRGSKKAMQRLIDIMMKDGTDKADRTLAISHVHCLEKALLFRDEVMQKMHFKDVIVLQAAGLCSTYANEDGLIVAY